MIEAYDEYKTYILGVQEVADEDVSKYGREEFLKYLIKIVEKETKCISLDE